MTTGTAAKTKTRITIRLDSDVLAWFRKEVRSSGGSYQTAINLALRDWIAREPLEATLRRGVRQEIAEALGKSSPDAYAWEPGSQVAEERETYGRPGPAVRRLRRRGRRG